MSNSTKLRQGMQWIFMLYIRILIYPCYQWQQMLYGQIS